MNEVKWSKSEKKIARAAFDKAFERECADLAGKIREKAEKIKEPEGIWELHDLLSRKRKEIDRKYDYRYSVIILVFAQLIKEGWLDVEDLEGLGKDKIEKITAVLGFSKS